MNIKTQSGLGAHLIRIGAYVAAVFWLGFMYAGWKLISTPETGKHSRLTGWAILIIATTIMIATMDYWVKYLQIILAGAILGGLLATFSGHLLNGDPFPRVAAGGITAFLIGCSLIAQSLIKRKLKKFDRIALAAFSLAFVSGMCVDTPTAALVGAGLGLLFLLLAWASHRFERRSNHDRSLRTTHSACIVGWQSSVIPEAADANRFCRRAHASFYAVEPCR